MQHQSVSGPGKARGNVLCGGELLPTTDSQLSNTGFYTQRAQY